jgi:hypothetical protein
MSSEPRSHARPSKRASGVVEEERSSLSCRVHLSAQRGPFVLEVPLRLPPRRRRRLNAVQITLGAAPERSEGPASAPVTWRRRVGATRPCLGDTGCSVVAVRGGEPSTRPRQPLSGTVGALDMDESRRFVSRPRVSGAARSSVVVTVTRSRTAGLCSRRSRRGRSGPSPRVPPRRDPRGGSSFMARWTRRTRPDDAGLVTCTIAGGLAVHPRGAERDA